MSALAPITIAGLAARTGIDVERIREYERLGLVGKPRRGPGGYLLYSANDAETLSIVRRAHTLGFTPEATRDLLRTLALPPDRARVAARAIALKQLDDVRARLATLHETERTLSALLSDCASAAARRPCPVIAAITARETPVSRAPAATVAPPPPAAQRR